MTYGVAVDESRGPGTGGEKTDRAGVSSHRAPTDASFPCWACRGYLIYFGVYVFCVSVCVCMCEYGVYMNRYGLVHMPVHACRGQRRALDILHYDCLLWSFETGSLCELGSVLPARLAASKPQRHPVSASLRVGITGRCRTTPGLLRECWDLNSGPHTDQNGPRTYYTAEDNF